MKKILKKKRICLKEKGKSFERAIIFTLGQGDKKVVILILEEGGGGEFPFSKNTYE